VSIQRRLYFEVRSGVDHTKYGVRVVNTAENANQQVDIAGIEVLPDCQLPGRANAAAAIDSAVTGADSNAET
jgi:hypothetical protein